MYVLRDVAAVPSEVEDPLQVDPTSNVTNSYFGKSGGLHDELTTCLPPSGPIYKYDNATVFLKIEKSSRSTSNQPSSLLLARRMGVGRT